MPDLIHKLEPKESTSDRTKDKTEAGVTTLKDRAPQIFESVIQWLSGRGIRKGYPE